MNKRSKRRDTTSEESEYSEDESEEEEKQKKYEPRFFKHTLSRLDLDKIIINVSRCHYPVVTQVAKRLSWKVESSVNNNWDIFWTDSAVQPQQLFRMLAHQKINHFPGMYIIARKDCLARGLMRMRRHQPAEYNYFPMTWHIPSEMNQFTVQLESAKAEGQKFTYIVKPEASCQGKGIFLTRKLETVQSVDQPCIVQRYIEKPYLINGLKFDFRIYVLLAGCDPLRIYMYHEGLARFATMPYTQPTKSNLKQSYIHLTNYAVNKDNPAFVFNTSAIDMNVGHKRSMTSVFKLLEKEGVNMDKVRQGIHEIIVKTIITGQPLLSHLYNLSQPENYANDMCFQILGFDIILEADATPRLLEVNHTPSFVADTPLDETIKGNLIRDTLILMNINKDKKQQKVDNGKEKQFLRSMRKKIKLTVKQKIQLKIKEQYERDEYEEKNIGGFTKIYPCNDTYVMARYQSLLAVAKNVFNKNNIKNKNRTEENSSPEPTRSRIKTVVSKIEQSVALLPLIPVPISTKNEHASTERTERPKLKKKITVAPILTIIDKDADRRLEAKIQDKIKHLENHGIQKELRSTKRLEIVKNMSLGFRGSIQKTMLSPLKAEVKHYASDLLKKGNFLAPRMINLGEMNRQMDIVSRKTINNYEKFLNDHDVKVKKAN